LATYDRRIAPGTAGKPIQLNLWFGRTLWGMFVRDDQIALDYLCSRPEVDKTRIGATGMSMGSTRLVVAAVDERIAATVGVACLTRYENLISTASCVRTECITSSTDCSSTLTVKESSRSLRRDRTWRSPAIWTPGRRRRHQGHRGKSRPRLCGERSCERFKSVLYPDIGHTYTPEMRAEMLAGSSGG